MLSSGKCIALMSCLFELLKFGEVLTFCALFSQPLLSLLVLVTDYANPVVAGNPFFDFFWDLFHLMIPLSTATSQ